MEVVFLIGVIQSIFLAALVFAKKQKMLADKILAVWLLFMGLHLFSYYMEVVGLNKEYPITFLFSACFPMLEGAFTFVYVSVITSQHQKFKPIFLLNLIPYAFFTIAFIVIVMLKDNLDYGKVILEAKNSNMPLLLVAGILNVFLGPLYLVLCLIKLHKHTNHISCNFSYTEQIDLKWLRYVVVIMSVVWIVVVVVNVLSNYNVIINYRLSDNIIYSTVTLAIFFCGFFGIKQQVIYSVPSLNEETTADYCNYESNNQSANHRYGKSGLKKIDSERYLNELLRYMEEEKPYIDGKLSLKQVAEKMNISTNYLSQVINENLQKNFFDFVNGYRVDLLKDKLADHSNNNYTLLAIAYDCGFNSKSSFNSIFKKHTGQTPSEYLSAI